MCEDCLTDCVVIVSVLRQDKGGIGKVEGNLEGGGDGFPDTSRVLVEYGHSLIIKLSTGSASANPSLQTGKD